MKNTLLTLTIFALFASGAPAQSLRASSPAPLQAGVNTSTTDNFTGTHYWYFFGGPGKVVLRATFAGGGLLGNPMNSAMKVTLSDGAGSFAVSKTIASSSNQDLNTATFSGNLKKRTRLLVSVAPPSQGLVRSGGQYTLEASGAVAFASSSGGGDPIVQTFYGDFGAPSGSAGAGGTADYGATKFAANGSIVASNGATGTWKLFDAGSHLYTIVLDGQTYSLKYEPGRGLVDPKDESIVFKALR